ncbi:MAG: LysR family transcriptional regulator [Enhydrobacter sp.]|nr:LysR family transcriptional regulator [Enhydrobacter sp.]
MIRRLEMAIAIDTHRSFHRAARALGISQPSLTRALQVLEEEMGARLFERGKNECEPTTFGQIVLTHARRIVSEIAETRREIALLQQLDIGSFSIGTGSAGVQHWVASAIGELCATYPNLKVLTSEHLWHQLPDMLMASEIDVAVGEATGLEGNPDIVVARLPRRPGAVVCRAGHPLTRLAKVGIEDLERYRLVGPHLARRFGLSFSPGSALGEMSEDSKYFVPAIVCASWPAIREIVARSDAIAFRARAVLTLPENRGSLSVLSFEAPWFMTELAIMWRRDRMQHPALKAFRDIARRNEALLMGEGRDRLHAVA